VKLPDDEIGNVDVEIWTSRLLPKVNIHFPNIFRNNTNNKKNVLLNYTKTDDGMFITSIEFDIHGYRLLR